VAAIEDAFEHHWRRFGGYPGARLRDEDGVLWFESPLRHLPYNFVIRTRIPGTLDTDAVIARVAGTFRDRGVPFMWLQRPSDRPMDLDRHLPLHGLDLVETATGMDLDLDGWQAPPDGSPAELRQVDAPGADPRGLRDYEELIRTYWSVPEEDRHLIETLNQHWTGERNPGVRLVAYLDGRPVGKCFANLEDAPAWVAVYGVAVRPEARGQGIATALMRAAIRIGVEAGARRAVLHSSSMALSMYRRMGFVARCELPVFATGALFGTHHH
jgi:GNAT superfamily N-acetyltransferase